MANEITFYPGVGADQAMEELHSLIGQITATWAGIEDQLFHIFVLAVAGTWLDQDVRPYRAVFFTFSSYEGRMRMLHNAMRARHGQNIGVMADWKKLRDCLNGFSALRNEIAHLVPTVKSSTNAAAKANVRLVPPFWKRTLQDQEFDTLGYSVDELWRALAPYWGYHPRIQGFIAPLDNGNYQLSYRVQQFALKLDSLNHN